MTYTLTWRCRTCGKTHEWDWPEHDRPNQHGDPMTLQCDPELGGCRAQHAGVVTPQGKFLYSRERFSQ